MRLIDADELKHNLANSDEVQFKYLEDFNKVCRFIDQQPTAAVRCGECKYHLPETERTNPYCAKYHCMRTDDWFCADGKRREE